MNEFGNFEGSVITEWLQHGGSDRDMLLQRDFSYIDQSGKRWTAFAGTTINGASIPSAFWVTIGPPFVGDYRRASVVHDAACIDRPGTSDEAHMMFYNAMRCDGVGYVKSNIMYQAVVRFGPQWGPEKTGQEFVRIATLDDARRLVEAVQQACAQHSPETGPREISDTVDEILQR